MKSIGINNFKDYKKISLIILSLALLSSLIPVESAYAISVTLDSGKQDLGDATISAASNREGAPVTSSGNNVYTLWREGTKVFFSSSINQGSSFTPLLNSLGDTGNTVTNFAPQIDSFGDNVYTIWSEDSTPGSDITYSSSLDKGATFGAKIILSSLTDTDNTSQYPQIEVSNSNNVYAVWNDVDDSNSPSGFILFKSGGVGGTDFATNNIVGVGGTDRIDPKPHIAESGDNIYTVWQTNDDIKFSRSTNGGTSFDPPVIIGETGSDSTPQIASQNNDVYIVWKQGSTIQFARSTNDGLSFSSPSEIGDGKFHKIAISGDNVYVVWEDAKEIKFRASTDRGASLENNPNDSTPADNLSNNPSASESPRISALGDKVYVSWMDTEFDALFDIFLKVSDDLGSSFSPVINVSNDAGLSGFPEMSVSGEKIYLTWLDGESKPFDVAFRSGTLGGPEISFDEAKYKENDSATITIISTDDAGLGPISITVSSSTDGGGIQVEGVEGPAGTFTGVVTFTTEDSDDVNDLLEVKPGDIITASYGGNNGIAAILPRIVEFMIEDPNNPGIGFVVNSFDLGSFAHVRVTDQNSNLDSGIIESIFVLITSNSDPDGVDLLLKETGVDTGIFGGLSNNNLIFVTDIDKVTRTGSMNVVQPFPGGNTNPNALDTVDVGATSSSDPAGIVLTLTETGVDTGEFSKALILSYYESGFQPNSLNAKSGDFISITNGFFKTNKIVTPNSNPANNAILVSIGVSGDEVTATYNSASKTVDVDEKDASGGGGGGLVRPGLVVNIIAGAGLFGGGSGGSANPTFGDATILVLDNQSDGFGGTISDGDDISLDSTKVVKVGDEVVLRFQLYENQGINNLERFKMFFNFEGKNYDASIIDTHVTYERSGVITIVDPYEKFDQVQIEILQEDAWNLIVKATVVFKNTFNTSILVESWDLERHSGKKLFPDALEVVESSILLPDTIKEFVKTNPSITQTELKEIPLWVKSNALWWQQKQIDDSDFMAGIEYLIQKTIIEIDENELANSITSKEPPVWLRDMAGMWADDSITDGEFVDAMQWLINNGILEVKQ